MDFPKYQYSKFIGQNQIVVRTNLVEEFEEMVVYVDDFKKIQPAPLTKPSVSVDDFYEKHICPTHGTQMRERTKVDGSGTYWDHRQKNEAGVWQKCFGKGWLK